MNKLTNHPLLIGLILLLTTQIGSVLAAPSLNGVASYEYLGNERFIAALYTDKPAVDSESVFSALQHRQMEIRCTNTFSARRHIRTWIEGAAINNPASVLKDYAEAMVAFTEMINVPLKPGDQVLIDAPVNSPVSVSLNGFSLGEIPQSGIFDVLLRTWVGNVPLSSTFRQNLLVRGDVDQELYNRFVQTRPSDDRLAYARSVADGSFAAAMNAEAQAEATPTAEAAAEPKPAPTTAVAAAKADTAPKPKAKPEASKETAEAQVAANPAPAKKEAENKELEVADTGAKPAPPPKLEVAAINKPALPAKSVDDEDDDDLLDTPLNAQTLLEQQLYHSNLLAWVYKKVSYPRRAVDRNYQGRVTLQATIDENGKLLEVATLEESKYTMLDRAAESAVKDSAPFPKPPMNLNGKPYTFTVPIEFKLQ